MVKPHGFGAQLACIRTGSLGWAPLSPVTACTGLRSTGLERYRLYRNKVYGIGMVSPVHGSGLLGWATGVPVHGSGLLGWAFMPVHGSTRRGWAFMPVHGPTRLGRAYTPVHGSTRRGWAP